MSDFKQRDWSDRRESDALQWHISQNRDMLMDYSNERRRRLKERERANKIIAKGILDDLVSKLGSMDKNPVESK